MYVLIEYFRYMVYNILALITGLSLLLIDHQTDRHQTYSKRYYYDPDTAVLTK